MSEKNTWGKLAERAWDERAKIWSENSRDMWDKGSRKNILPFCKQYFSRNGSVLDVGCGSGYSTYQLQQLGFDVTGVDISHQMIQYAKEQFSEIHFQQGDVHKLPFDAEQFSGILAINVLEWTASPQIALKELSRMLHQDGMLCIGILGPTAGPRQNSFNRLLGEEVFMNTMMPWELLKLAIHEGFELVDQLIVDKKWGGNIKGQLPIEGQQALSFMTVFMLRRGSQSI